MRLPPEVAALLEKAALHPEGGNALLEGHLESVAALYQLHPERVEQVRDAVAEPALMAQALEILGRSRTQPPSPSPSVGLRKDHHRLIAEASLVPNGHELLTRAPLEPAAVLLGAHPFDVELARTHLAQTGSPQ